MASEFDTDTAIARAGDMAAVRLGDAAFTAHLTDRLARSQPTPTAISIGWSLGPQVAT